MGRGSLQLANSDTDEVGRRSRMQACATVCRACGDECEQHAAMPAHCRVCAEVCRSCHQACEELINALG
jgi:hypothetical protein